MRQTLLVPPHPFTNQSPAAGTGPPLPAAPGDDAVHRAVGQATAPVTSGQAPKASRRRAAVIASGRYPINYPAPGDAFVRTLRHGYLAHNLRWMRLALLGLLVLAVLAVLGAIAGITLPQNMLVYLPLLAPMFMLGVNRDAIFAMNNLDDPEVLEWEDEGASLIEARHGKRLHARGILDRETYRAYRTVLAAHGDASLDHETYASSDVHPEIRAVAWMTLNDITPATLEEWLGVNVLPANLVPYAIAQGLTPQAVAHLAPAKIRDVTDLSAVLHLAHHLASGPGTLLPAHLYPDPITGAPPAPSSPRSLADGCAALGAWFDVIGASKMVAALSADERRSQASGRMPIWHQARCAVADWIEAQGTRAGTTRRQRAYRRRRARALEALFADLTLPEFKYSDTIPPATGERHGPVQGAPLGTWIERTGRLGPIFIRDGWAASEAFEACRQHPDLDEHALAVMAALRQV